MGSRARAIVLGLCAAGLAIGLLILLALASIDAGWADRPIETLLSRRLGRAVTFTRLQAHLLSSKPTIRLTHLAIGNPPWLPRAPMAEMDSLEIHLRFWPMLTGRLVVDELRIDGPSLHLIRFGPGRNNWAVSPGGHGPAFAPLATVGRFTVTNGRIVFRDLARGLIFRGTFDHGNGRRPAFRIAGGGLLKGEVIGLRAVGGALNGESVGKPYPFAADLVDAATTVTVQGTSGDAFNLTTYALDVRAAGPNLADVGYLFNLITPNTAPFEASARAFSDGTHLRFDALDMKVGASRVGGRIWSDHSGARREVRAAFDASVLARQDIEALLQPVPPRHLARVRSGAVTVGPPGRWIITDAPISLRRMRGADFDFTVRISRLTGYPLPLTDVSTRLDLDHGLLDFPFFRGSVYSGKVVGTGRLDARSGLPKVRVAGRLSDIDLHRLFGGAMSGRVDAHLDLAGQGVSLHSAAGAAAGSVAVTVADAAIPKRASWMLGGDLLRAALAGAHGQTRLRCLSADLAGAGGRLAIRRFAIATPNGTATGNGTIDLGTESLDVVLQGRPDRRRLFQVSAPVRIAGPWLKPAVTILPGRAAHALGLRGTLGVLLTPVAALLPIGSDPVAAASCK